MKWLVFAVALTACGGNRKQIEDEQQRFACRDRSASYIATKHIAGSEIGFQLDCAEAGPRIKRWKTDQQGKHEQDAHGMTPGEFDKVWSEIDGTGWPNLKDCTNGSLEKRDPVYMFDIKDDQNKASFSCQTREVPYPYNDITNALDEAAARGHGQLGDDEPADAKALDKKDKQR